MKKLGIRPKQFFRQLFMKGGLFLVVCLMIGLILNHYLEQQNLQNGDFSIGLSYSPSYAKSLGLDWKQTYLQIMSDLSPKMIRLNTPWNELEPTLGNYAFSDIDFMLELAQTNKTRVLLVLGGKQPRWPECHYPQWSRELSLPQRQAALLEFVEQVVSRYKDKGAIWGWQVENEPLFTFGAGCDPVDRSFLEKEVAMVKELDSSRPVILTDSGELRPWREAMQRSDIFGTTLYRDVTTPYFGAFHWPLPPLYYQLKSTLARSVFAPNNQSTIIAELQAEPWSEQGIPADPIDNQVKAFPVTKLEYNLDFAKKTGFSEFYLWGVEWWYYMQTQSHPEYLDYAQQVFSKN